MMVRTYVPASRAWPVGLERTLRSAVQVGSTLGRGACGGMDARPDAAADHRHRGLENRGRTLAVMPPGPSERR